MAELRESVGEGIKLIRKSQSLTQRQLAERSDLDDAYIGAVERGERNFSIDTLSKIVNGLGISPVELFRFNNDSVNNDQERQQLIDEFAAAISTLTPDKLDIVRNINKELLRAFQINNPSD